MRRPEWDIVLSHARADTGWARWLSWHLAEAGYRVITQTPEAADPRAEQTLVLWSAAYQAQITARGIGDDDGGDTTEQRPIMLVRLEDCPRPAPYAGLLAFDLFGLDAATARDWLLRQIATVAPRPAGALAPPPFPSRTAAGDVTDARPAATAHADAPDVAVLGPGSAGENIRENAVAAPGPRSRPAPPRPAPARLGTPRRLAVLAQERGHPLAVTFSPAMPLVVTAGTDTMVHLWTLPFPDPPRLAASIGYGRRINQEWARAVTLSPDGRTLAAAGDAGTTLLWQLVTGPALGPAASTGAAPPTSTPALTAAPTTMPAASSRSFFDALAPDASPFGAAASAPPAGIGGSGPAVVRPVPLLALTGHRGYVHDVDFSPGGTLLATAGDDRVVLLWDLAEPGAPTRAAILAGHRAAVRAVAFSPDGTQLATASADRTVTLWDLTEPTRPRATATLAGARGPLHTLAFSPDGDLLAAAGRDRTVRLYSVADPTRDQQIAAFGEHRRAVHAVTFSPDGHLLATAGADRVATVRLVTDPEHPGPPQRLDAHSGAVHAVAFAPDSRLLATASADGTTALWDLFPDEQPVPPPPPPPT
ncbi:WD40 repeat-containing protein [Frankia sp. AiPs1]|uniref:toll/interleukin-1 receptor domain-containing protein n=1 Tax=Frankia sp. AiPa1 TaxID=573492 RepID=UPI00202B0BA4|nr:TIR domain-containing protein [Frankia sp. AiPa1]MCL9759377.1 hypothetical protein [Frankia sp. AiPa1]